MTAYDTNGCAMPDEVGGDRLPPAGIRPGVRIDIEGQEQGNLSRGGTQIPFAVHLDPGLVAVLGEWRPE
ncbi:hypothetical protein [Sediminivirga luteola]|uniref:hypothetical protein n=1 Tax=Sediminivirga luteola TaxID=1774748 RepID=UPI001F59EBD4|nr:hypothetical protein [Sediminivirga luteola]MCI2267085.1 hypothetical protein [Sediminivirga luteola]